MTTSTIRITEVDDRLDNAEFIQQLNHVLAGIELLEHEKTALLRQICFCKDPADIISLLYWKYSNNIKPSEISEAMGIPLRDLKQDIGTALISVPCNICGIEIETEVSSISAKLTYERDSRSSRWSRGIMCSNCKSKEAEENKQRSERGKQQQQLMNQRRALLATMPYAEYLQTPEWQATRKERLRRAKYRCELCHKQKTLHVHHKTYERRGFEYPDDLIVLCEDCHAKFHDKVVNE